MVRECSLSVLESVLPLSFGSPDWCRERCQDEWALAFCSILCPRCCSSVSPSARLPHSPSPSKMTSSKEWRYVLEKMISDRFSVLTSCEVRWWDGMNRQRGQKKKKVRKGKRKMYFEKQSQRVRWVTPPSQTHRAQWGLTLPADTHTHMHTHSASPTHTILALLLCSTLQLSSMHGCTHSNAQELHSTCQLHKVLLWRSPWIVIRSVTECNLMMRHMTMKHKIVHLSEPLWLAKMSLSHSQLSFSATLNREYHSIESNPPGEFLAVGYVTHTAGKHNLPSILLYKSIADRSITSHAVPYVLTRKPSRCGDRCTEHC